jgi:UDP-N-acetylglucosamine 2-epimerase (non-hydrolysing)
MKVLLIIGTRPEAIKMAPLIKRLKDNKKYEVFVCNTGQHKELLNPVLSLFKIEIDYDLETMEANQTLTGLTSKIITGLNKILIQLKPNFIFVHGDTTTSFASALAAFYQGIKIIHIEAGLRTFNKYSPFPEEMNRTLTGSLADFHFAPTMSAKENLLKQGIINNVFISGNTVIDALFDAVNLIDTSGKDILELKSKIDFNKKIILFTGHRRENFGDGFESIFKALTKITNERSDVLIIYPVHPNPNVQISAFDNFKNNKNVILINPLNYGAFVWLLKNCYLILTDSGGIQEEAPSLGKPVLVLRELTERPEAVEAGTVILVGSDSEKIYNLTNKLLDDQEFYSKMSDLINPYGDGKAAERIIEILSKELK